MVLFCQCRDNKEIISLTLAVTLHVTHKEIISNEIKTLVENSFYLLKQM